MAKQYQTDCTNTIAGNFAAKKQLAPNSPNWENSEVAFLATITAGEVCPDYSPSMLELASV